LSMKVNIFYPKLQQLTGPQGQLEVKGGTLGECLSNLAQQFPSAEKLLFDECGRPLKQVFIYINALIIAVLVTGG
jgi:hypothetical protein